MCVGVSVNLTRDALHGNIDQTRVNSLHGMLNCGIGGFDCPVTTAEYKHVSIIYRCNTYCVIHWSVQFIRECLANVLMQYRCSSYSMRQSVEVKGRKIIFRLGLKSNI